MKKNYLYTAAAVLAAALLFSFAACGEKDGGGDKVATPTASLASGTVAAGATVTLSCSTSGADIFYTTTGTNPTNASTKYNSTPITINATMTLKAIGIKDGMTSSDVLQRNYTVAGNPGPVIEAPPSGATLGAGEKRVYFDGAMGDPDGTASTGNWVVLADPYFQVWEDSRNGLGLMDVDANGVMVIEMDPRDLGDGGWNCAVWFLDKTANNIAANAWNLEFYMRGGIGVNVAVNERPAAGSPDGTPALYEKKEDFAASPSAWVKRTMDLGTASAVIDQIVITAVAGVVYLHDIRLVPKN